VLELSTICKLNLLEHSLKNMNEINGIDKKVCIIGAGLSGLSAAFDLGKLGFKVQIFESGRVTGGLASSVHVNCRPIERFYHFICKGDRDLLVLVDEIGLSDKLHWQQSKTGFFFDGKSYNFSTPFDLFRFEPVPYMQKIRFGLNVIQNRYRKSWRQLDGIAAYPWLINQIGVRAYEVIWDPLLRVKFGEYFDKISAAWIWHRIHRVASSRRRIWQPEYLGYLEYGSETIIEALVDILRKMHNVEIFTEMDVRSVEVCDESVKGITIRKRQEIIECDYVISTVALPILSRMMPHFDLEYRKRIESIDYIGVVCGLLKLSNPISEYFWLNVNDEDITFNGVIEYTNLNKHLRLNGKSIIYIPYYLPTNSERFSFSDEQLVNEFIDGLGRINPGFKPEWIEEFVISRAKYAQSICTVGFADIMPEHTTPIKGLYITDSTQFYPEDRTISGAIRVGRKTAELIMQDTVL